MSIAVGFDCGGTSVRVLAMDSSGSTVFEGRSGPANLASTPPDKILDHIKEATLGLPPVAAAAAGMAGMMTNSDEARGGALFHQVLGAVPIKVVPDWEIALETAGDACDGLLIAGTGSIVCSYRNGVRVKSGGAGPVLGDEGSVMDLCRRALNHLLIRSQTLPMTGRVKGVLVDAYGSSERNEVLAAIYSSNTPAKETARIARAVADDFREGADYAVLSTKETMAALNDLVMDHFGPDRTSVKLATTGGLFRVLPEASTMLAEASKESGLLLDLEPLAVEPVHGAIKIAWSLLS
jgi:N-acetylglucosamine kinase-like BadF-type ATPase